jgi:hypothetical protein
MPKHTIYTPGDEPQTETPEADGAEPSIRDTLAAMQAKIDAQAEQIAAMGKAVPAKAKEVDLPTEAEGMAQAKKTGQNVLSQSGWCMAPAVAAKA